MANRAWCVALLLAISSPVGADSGEYRVGADFTLDAVLAMVHEDRAAGTARSRADADHDGQVNATEAALAGQRMTKANEMLPPVSLPTGLLRLNGALHNRTQVVAITLEGAEGAVNGTSAVVERWHLVLHFPASGTLDHIRMEPGNRSRAGHLNMQLDTLILHLPEGMRVVSSGGLPLYAAVSPGGERVDFPAGLPGHGDVILLVAPTPTREAAADAPSLAMAAVLLAAGMRRRASRLA